MLRRAECRIDNWISYGGENVQINSLTKEKVGFFHRLHPGKEIFREFRSLDVGPIELTKGLIEHALHFVPYQGPDYREGESGEYTDGRIILRINPGDVAVFQPNDFPWAKEMGIHMDYICTISTVGQLQNIYFDLFGVDLNIENMA